MPADKSRTAIVRLYGGNCFSSRFVRTRGVLWVLPVKDNPSVCLRQPPPFTQGRHGWESAYSVGDRFVCGHRLFYKSRYV